PRIPTQAFRPPCSAAGRWPNPRTRPEPSRWCRYDRRAGGRRAGSRGGGGGSWHLVAVRAVDDLGDQPDVRTGSRQPVLPHRGVVFGRARGLAVLRSARCRTAPALRQLHLRLSLLEPLSLRIAVAAEALAAGGLGYAAAGIAGGIAALLAAGLLVIAGDPRLA